MSRNRCLNFIKGIGCIGVVFIHIQFPGEFGKLIFLLARFAVPICFMISGYYAFGAEENTIFRRLKKIIRIFICTIIPYAMYTYFHPMEFEFSVVNFCRMIFLGDFSFIYAGIVWFLIAQIYGYLFLLFCNKKSLYPKVYVMIPILFGFGVWERAFATDAFYFNNFLLTGIPYMLLGNYIARYESKIKKKTNNIIIIVSICASIIFIGLRRFFDWDITYLGVIVYSLGMFLFAIQNPTFVLSKTLERIGEKYSLYVYVSHPLLINLFAYKVQNEWLRPIVILVASLFVSMVLEKVFSLNKKNNQQN